MTEPHDRDEIVELMSRYAAMPDTRDWDELPRSVFCDELTADFSSLGGPVTTVGRGAWCRRSKEAFAPGGPSRPAGSAQGVMTTLRARLAAAFLKTS